MVADPLVLQLGGTPLPADEPAYAQWLYIHNSSFNDEEKHLRQSFANAFARVRVMTTASASAEAAAVKAETEARPNPGPNLTLT